MNVVYVSIVSAVIAFSSFLFNLLIYLARRRLEQASNAAKLHEKWWSEEYYSSRRKVYSLIQDWNKGEDSGVRSKYFLEYYSSGEIKNKPEEFVDFTKLVFFFSDLNVYIDEELISTSLAYRLFDNPQYKWFEAFIDAVRTKIKEQQTSDSDNKNKIVRWVEETEVLEQKFSCYRKGIGINKEALQIVLAILGVIPFIIGSLSLVLGEAALNIVEKVFDNASDSMIRFQGLFLSSIVILGYCWIIPSIDRQTILFRLLLTIVSILLVIIGQWLLSPFLVGIPPVIFIGIIFLVALLLVCLQSLISRQNNSKKHSANQEMLK